MTPEEKKKADETAAADAQAKAEKEQADADFEASIADLSDEEKEAKRAERDASNPVNLTDLEQRLKEERERADNEAAARRKAEDALAGRRFKAADKRRKQEGDDASIEDDEEEKPLTPSELEARLAEERQATDKILNGSRIRDIATDISENETEAELTIAIHKNRSWPASVPLEQQVAEAYAIATRKTAISKAAELKRALKSKDNASNDAAGAHREGLPLTRPKTAPDLEQSLKRQNFEYDDKLKVYKKKLPTGKFLYKQVAGTKVIKTWSA